MSKTFIYGLIDPRSESIRYVGKSANPAHRLSVHLDYKNSRTSMKSKWIHDLAMLGMQPSLVILEDVESGESDSAEKKWITYYLEQGSDLVNSNKGGRGYDHKTHKLQPHDYRRGFPTFNELFAHKGGLNKYGQMVWSKDED